MRLRVEYGREGSGNPEAIEVYAREEIRELTYKAMDEVLKADISEAELMTITRLVDSIAIDLFSDEHVPHRLSDTITLSYQSGGGSAKSCGGEAGSPQWDSLYEIWSAMSDLSRRYFIPRFY